MTLRMLVVVLALIAQGLVVAQAPKGAESLDAAAHRGRPAGSAGHLGFPQRDAARAPRRVRGEGNHDRRRGRRLRAARGRTGRRPSARRSAYGAVGPSDVVARLRQDRDQDQTHVADRRSGRRTDSAADAGGAAAARRAPCRRAQPRPGRLVRGSQPVRALPDARRAGGHAARPVQQQHAAAADARLRR